MRVPCPHREGDASKTGGLDRASFGRRTSLGRGSQVSGLPDLCSGRRRSVDAKQVGICAFVCLVGATVGCRPAAEPVQSPPPAPLESPLTDAGAVPRDAVRVPPPSEVSGPAAEVGRFRMGRPLRQGFTDEQPVHLVGLDEFWLGRTAVTNEQYAEFLNSTEEPEDLSRWLNLEDAAGLECGADGAWSAVEGRGSWPVVGVTWFGAQAYSESDGGRLPTEAEWEWAAVGPEWRVYPWGDEWDPSRLCCKENPGEPYVDVDSHPDGASWCGALNMGGNCWEWCADWYGAYSREPSENPTGPTEGTERVIRGGYYNNAADLFRGSCRLRQEPAVGRDGIGFRSAYDRSPANHDRAAGDRPNE